MTQEERKIFEVFLSKALNMDSEAVASLFNEAGELTTVEPLLTLNAERVAKNREIAESQYKRGIKESREKLEKELKTKYGINSDLQGLDLIEEILVKETETLKKSSTVSEEDFEKHPKFIEKRREFEKQLKQKELELLEKFNAEKSAIEYEYIFEKARNKARAALLDGKFILPDDQLRKEKLLRVFENELKELYKYKPTEDGSDFIVLDKEGNVAQDKQGNMLKFSEIVTNIGSYYFPTQTSEPRSNSGNTGTGGVATVYKFKDKADYIQQMKAAGNDVKKLAEISKAWEGQQLKE